MNKKQIANNILELMINPTIVPVEKRIYIGPEEKLDNRSYEKAKEESFLAYRNQHNNSDMYPIRNRKLTRMGGFSMDRRTMVASLDILAKKFASEEDPMATDLRTMAYAFSKMSEEEYTARVAEEEESSEKNPEEESKTANAWMDHMKKVREDNPGKSLKELIGIAKKTYKKEATEEEIKQASVLLASDAWSKEASDAVAQALVEDVTGKVLAGKKKGPGIPDGTGPMKDSPACPFNKDVKEEKESCNKAAEVPQPEKKDLPVKKDEVLPVEKKAAEKKEDEEEADKSAVVDTSILVANNLKPIDTIEMAEGMLASEDIGELSSEEKSKLDLLFQ